MFLQVCVIHSVHRGGMRGFIRGGVHGFIQGGMHGFIRGACVVLFGGHAWFYLGGHVWFYLGGICGFIWGACMVLFGGHARFYSGGACMVLFRGHAWFYSGACMVLFGGVCVVFSVFSDTMRYGQWAGGTHPTGMHSCSKFCVLFLCFADKIFQKRHLITPDLQRNDSYSEKHVPGRKEDLVMFLLNRNFSFPH